VDHKEATKTSLVAQTVEPFEPSEEEIEKARLEASTRRLGPPPLKLRLDAARLPASAIDDLKDLLGSFPGESEVVLELLLSVGDPRTLRLGNAFKVAPTPTLRAELEQILGPAVVRAPAAAAPTAAA
jgi:DNA polymerase III subunit alpha